MIKMYRDDGVGEGACSPCCCLFRLADTSHPPPSPLISSTSLTPLPQSYFSSLFLGYFKISSDFVYVCYSHRPPSPLISSNILALPLRFFCKIVCLFCFAKFCIYVYIVFLVLLLLENKVMQAVAAEPAVALEALPPATFDCIELHHKE